MQGKIMNTPFRNPVIPGFHPDPSICRVGRDYYLVTSTFCYFPAVPVFHSRDLVHWERIGNCLDRDSQVNLDDTGTRSGIFAPTIRYHKGRFFMVVTNVTSDGTFLVNAKDPRGPWSDPVFFKERGIDPSLFFDDDGRCHIIHAAAGGIFHCVIDPFTGEQLSPHHRIWNGTGGRYPEAPHLFKKDGFYYLMIAEGGTEYGHKVTIARSEDIEGPYLGNPANPILTHINKNAQYSPFQGVGHADLVQTHEGRWMLVCLAFRPQNDRHHLLGRETFLAPVDWPENGWPVVNGNGTLPEEGVSPLRPAPLPEPPARTRFTMRAFGPEWLFWHNPHRDAYTLDGHALTLRPSPGGLDAPGSPTFVGRRTEHHEFTATTCVEALDFADGDEAGLTLLMAQESHYDIALRREGGAYRAVARLRLRELRHAEAELPLPGPKAWLRLVGTRTHVAFLASVDGRRWTELWRMDNVYLSTETAGGFTGTLLGLFAGTGTPSSAARAKVPWFDYRGESGAV